MPHRLHEEDEDDAQDPNQSGILQGLARRRRKQVDPARQGILIDSFNRRF